MQHFRAVLSALCLEADINAYSQVVNLLTRVCGNLHQNPREPKFASLSLSNAVLATQLVPFPSALAFLEMAGFDRTPDGRLVAGPRTAQALPVAVEALSHPPSHSETIAKHERLASDGFRASRQQSAARPGVTASNVAAGVGAASAATIAAGSAAAGGASGNKSTWNHRGSRVKAPFAGLVRLRVFSWSSIYV